MAGKLTDLAVKGAKPQEKRYTLFDTGGLYLEVAPNGGKWWRFRYRLNGKQKVISLGTYPEVGLRNAREQRDAARTLLANGGDPARKKLEESENAQVPTFKSLAEEWFALKSREWVERHAIRIRQKMDKYLMGHLGPKPFADLMITDFLPILRSIEKRGKFETARRVAQMRVLNK